MTEATARPAPPMLLAVDDDPPVLAGVVADLRSRYGQSYRVVGAGSGAEAIEVIERATRRGTQVAAVIADQRMPEQTGTELLAAAKRLQPMLRSVLLTAYADTDAAIEAINTVSLDHYIMKPWDPPEERLYPIIDELLEEWNATRPRQDPGIRVIGDRWAAACHRLREYLARNQVPFRWLDAEQPEAVALLEAVGDDGRVLPVLVLDDGRTFPDPEPAEVAQLLGLSGRAEVDFYDLVVVGAGPAGLAAAVYGGSEGLRTLVVEAEAPGGQAGLSSRIENYLGFPAGVSGSELARRALAQARRFGSVVVSPRRAVRLGEAHTHHVVALEDGSELHCGAVVLATGVQYRRLDATGADDLTGSGVYYGASAFDPETWKGERVVIVGGANSAGQAAIHLSATAAEVVVVIRAASLEARMSRYLVDRIARTDNIVTYTGSRVVGVRGEHRLSEVEIETDGSTTDIPAAGMFVFIGARPRTEWLGSQVVRDDHGFIVTGPALKPHHWALDRDPFLLETSRPGVFAVGDVRAASFKRVASAVGEGSAAVQSVHAVLHGG